MKKTKKKLIINTLSPKFSFRNKNGKTAIPKKMVLL
jgi:hypothetical protein